MLGTEEKEINYKNKEIITEKKEWMVIIKDKNRIGKHRKSNHDINSSMWKIRTAKRLFFAGKKHIVSPITKISEKQAGRHKKATKNGITKKVFIKKCEKSFSKILADWHVNEGHEKFLQINIWIDKKYVQNVFLCSSTKIKQKKKQ